MSGVYDALEDVHRGRQGKAREHSCYAVKTTDVGAANPARSLALLALCSMHTMGSVQEIYQVCCDQARKLDQLRPGMWVAKDQHEPGYMVGH